jgi:Smg protein
MRRLQCGHADGPRHALGYIGFMFEVLAFVYENYWRGDACPRPEQLGRKLTAQGFDAEEISVALCWLDGLSRATQGLPLLTGTDPGTVVVGTGDRGSDVLPASAGAMRVYSAVEQDLLGAECLGFLHFLEVAGVLRGGMREIVIERAMAAPACPVSLDDFKIILLMVYWSSGQEPDALVLDELVTHRRAGAAH